MKAEDYSAIENQRQALLGQLRTAEAALRNGLQTRGFGETSRAHLDRPLAHVQEAYLAINETKSIRTVAQLVDDLNRLRQLMDDAGRKPQQSQHI
jgi:hypothetical protein